MNVLDFIFTSGVEPLAAEQEIALTEQLAKAYTSDETLADNVAVLNLKQRVEQALHAKPSTS